MKLFFSQMFLRVNFFILSIFFLQIFFAELAVAKAVLNYPEPPETVKACITKLYDEVRQCTGVSTRKWERGKYVCVDFSKDICAGFESSDVGRAHAWVVKVRGDKDSHSFSNIRCMYKSCNETALDMISKACKGGSQCVAEKMEGHALVLVRNAIDPRYCYPGQNPTSIAGKSCYSFSFIEPQVSGSNASYDSWLSTLSHPQLRDKGWKKFLNDHYPEATKCGLKYLYSFDDCNISNDRNR